MYYKLLTFVFLFYFSGLSFAQQRTVPIYKRNLNFSNIQECEKAYAEISSMASADISDSEELICYRCTLALIPENECYSYKETGRYNNVEAAKKCMRR